MTTDGMILLIFGGAALIMVCSVMRRRRRLLSALFGAGTGLAALLLLSRFGPALGEQFPLNPFSLAGSALLGVPFVAGLALLRVI
ncbi:MAG: pro-sigmaK processing inhibitor BofA family protein [Ruminococcus sp.]|nr:pro-sigmaK processing inhibitor BofA family protein [Ruminococcus sp.]